MARSTLVSLPWFEDNPWQGLLYSSAGQSCEIVGRREIGDLDPDLGQFTPESTTLHINWTSVISQVEPNVWESMRAVDRALNVIDKFRAAGGRVIWTVHNVLPHDCHFMIPEIALCQGLADRADAIHIMNPRTSELVSGFYSLPIARVHHIPHSSFQDAIEEPMTQAEARGVLGLESESTIVLAFGQMRPYKGIEQLARLAGDPEFRDLNIDFVAAGRFSHGLNPSALQNESRGMLRVIDRYLDSEQLHTWIVAADVIALPYSQILNSGSLELAATLGRPVLIGASPATDIYRDSGWVQPVDFENLDAAEFKDLISRCQEMQSEYALIALEHARLVQPKVISERFLELALND